MLFLRRLHGQRDPASVDIDIDDRYHDFLVDLDDIRRVFHVSVRQFANMNQAVLMNAYVYKSPESSDVGDNARKLHTGL